MKKLLIVLLFCMTTISLNAYYFNNRFLENYSINKPFFEGRFEFGGDEKSLQKIGTYFNHIVNGELSLDDLDTPVIQLYSSIGFIENLYGGKFYIYNKGLNKFYTDDIDLKLERKIYQLNFYQQNKIYNKMYGGVIAKIFYQEYKFKEDKSLIKELLEDEYKEEKKLYGFDFQWGTKYNLENFIFDIQIGPEVKFYSFDNSEQKNEKYNTTTVAFSTKVIYNLPVTLFLQPMLLTFSIFYNKNYFEDNYGGEFKWKINKYFFFGCEISNNSYMANFKLTPVSFFSFDMRVENSIIKYKPEYKYNIDERNTEFFIGISLKFQSFGIPSFRNK